MDWQKKVSLWWAKNFRPLVVALLVGSVVGAVMLGLLRKPAAK